MSIGYPLAIGVYVYERKTIYCWNTTELSHSISIRIMNNRALLLNSGSSTTVLSSFSQAFICIFSIACILSNLKSTFESPSLLFSWLICLFLNSLALRRSSTISYPDPKTVNTVISPTTILKFTKKIIVTHLKSSRKKNIIILCKLFNTSIAGLLKLISYLLLFRYLCKIKLYVFNRLTSILTIVFEIYHPTTEYMNRVQAWRLTRYNYDG